MATVPVWIACIRVVFLLFVDLNRWITTDDQGQQDGGCHDTLQKSYALNQLKAQPFRFPAVMIPFGHREEEYLCQGQTFSANRQDVDLFGGAS